MKEIPSRRYPATDKSEQLLWLGLYDNLTNLPNRYLFLDRLHHIKRQAAREKYEFAVLMIELGNLKQINEQHGYHAGDRALITIADRIRELARDSDTVARFGGDEFTVILRNINCLEDAESIAGKYLRAVTAPIPCGRSSLQVQSAIGMSYYPQHSEDINELLHMAEKARLIATHKDGPVSVYSDVYADAVADNLYNYDLDQIFREEQIRFKYQPICALQDRAIVALEALCRWNHPVMGEIYPDRLIVDTHNSPAIKSFVSNSLHTILNQHSRWHEKGISLPVHFNLSAYMLNDPLTTELIFGLLEDSGVEPRSLVIELTETEYYSMNRQTIQVIQDLAGYGIKIALDDFGVGFSSLSHLLEFPIDVIKIDKVFVAEIHSNTRARIITESLITIAHKLGAKVVAEGVDHDDAIRLLRQLECDYIQSHHYYKPLSVAQVEKRLSGGG